MKLKPFCWIPLSLCLVNNGIPIIYLEHMTFFQPMNPWEHNGRGFGYRIYTKKAGDSQWGEKVCQRVISTRSHYHSPSPLHPFLRFKTWCQWPKPHCLHISYSYIRWNDDGVKFHVSCVPISLLRFFWDRISNTLKECNIFPKSEMI